MWLDLEKGRVSGKVGYRADLYLKPKHYLVHLLEGPRGEHVLGLVLRPVSNQQAVHVLYKQCTWSRFVHEFQKMYDVHNDAAVHVQYKRRLNYALYMSCTVCILMRPYLKWTNSVHNGALHVLFKQYKSTNLYGEISRMKKNMGWICSPNNYLFSDFIYLNQPLELFLCNCAITEKNIFNFKTNLQKINFKEDHIGVKFQKWSEFMIRFL